MFRELLALSNYKLPRLLSLRKEKLEHQNQDLFIERNNLPFTKKSRSSISLLINALRDGNIEIRRYEKSFLHAKSYIFSKLSNDKSDVSDSIFVGSSNLTKSGMISNLELNLKDENQETISNTIQWFDKLWDEAEPFDLASIFEEVFEIKTPFDIFLRVLWELYGDEITDEKDHDGGLPLTSFQQHGVVRALRLIDENGGVIVADEVGLGKTFQVWSPTSFEKFKSFARKKALQSRSTLKWDNNQ